MFVECVCCNNRVDVKNRRPFHGVAMRLFVSARTNTYLPESGFICNSCRMLYLKWRGNTEFAKVLNQIEPASNEVKNNNDDTVRFFILIIGIW